MDNNELRSEKLIRNTVWSIIGYLGYAVAGFVSRSLFVNYLGEELTGISTLFASMMNLLSVAEMGFTGAVSIHLYQPVADGDERRVSALIHLYKKAYQAISVLVFAVGMAVLFFIPMFVKSELDLSLLRWYFFLHIVRTTLSYCYIYKGILLSSYQVEYKKTNIYNAVLILTTVVQIVVIWQTASYTLYLVTAIVGTLVTNVLTQREASKNYPYLDKYKEERISAEEKKSIFEYIKAASVNRISISVKTATDNMITSAFVNVLVTGVVGNYVMITGTVDKLVSFFFLNSAPAIGNMVATTDKDSQFNTFLDLEYIAFWVYGFLSAGMLCVTTPFVRDIWIRQDNMLLANSTLLLLILNFYLGGTNFPATVFFEVRGLVKRVPYMNVLNVVVNLVVSLSLVKWMGVNGVYIGTILSLLVTTLPMTHYQVLKHHFDGKFVPYVRLYGYYLIVTILGGAACCCACGCIALTGFPGLFAKIAACTLVYNLIFLLSSFRTREFRSIFALVCRILGRK